MGWIILLRVVLSVSANAVQKRLLLDRAGVNHTWILTYSMMFAPAMILVILQPHGVGSGFWKNILLGGGLDAMGNLAMVAALRVTDLSIFGPLNALRPILALLFGWLFLGEQPTPIGLVGVAVTVVGGVVLFSGESRGSTRGVDVWKPLFLRTLGLSLGVAGAVFLKRAAMVSSAEITVAAWIFCGLVVLLAFAAFRHRDVLVSLPSAGREHWRWLAVHSAVFLAMQWLTIRIFQETLLAYSFVFFQLGMVLQVFVGRMFFSEGDFGRRLIAAMIMALGSVLILWRG
jgi:drug/metabolite transporter (DMT)-like permease